MTKDRRQMTEFRKQNTEDRFLICGFRSLSSVLGPLFSVVLAVALAGCASSTEASSPAGVNVAAAPQNNQAEASADSDFEQLDKELEERTIEVPDPLEPFNRVMFGVNDVLYFWVVKPVAQTYEGVVPVPARVGIGNFFGNAATPIRYVNCLLQGKNEGADTELRRFLINTTAGVLGFGDPAMDQHGLKPVEEDLGQTLATYGFHDGFYIVWPFFGPSTARNSVGMLGDQFLNPLWYVEPTELSIGISAVKYTNSASFQLGRYEVFKAAAVDPYIAMRESYIQYRDKQIRE